MSIRNYCYLLSETTVPRYLESFLDHPLPKLPLRLQSLWVSPVMVSLWSKSFSFLSAHTVVCPFHYKPTVSSRTILSFQMNHRLKGLRRGVMGWRSLWRFLIRDLLWLLCIRQSDFTIPVLLSRGIIDEFLARTLFLSSILY